jgi:hypothetical protein
MRSARQATQEDRSDERLRVGADAQRQSEAASRVAVDLPQAVGNRSMLQMLRETSGSQALPDGLRLQMESALHTDFSSVRIHSNSSAALALGARAYTRGNELHFAPGQYQPTTSEGRRIVGHELAHVVQQRQGRVQATREVNGVGINDHAALEAEADRWGAMAERGQQAPVQSYMGGNSTVSAPVQRLVGFEIEYQVPTWAGASQAVTVRDGKQAPAPAIKNFLFGGLKYGSERGGSAKPGDDSFRLTSDHNRAVSREPVRAALAARGKLEPADTRDPDHHSNLEYVTSPVDELAPGSNKKLTKLFRAVAAHAEQTFAVAKDYSAGRIPAPATPVATGVPVRQIKDWLSAEDWRAVAPSLKSLYDNIADSCYIQMTVGVLPSAIGRLFKEAREGGLHASGGKFDHIFEAIDTASKAIGAKLAEHDYIKGLRDEGDNQTLASVAGLLRLLVMYKIGEALSQTSAHPGGTIKNAVPFLVKLAPSMIAEAGGWGLIFNPVSSSFAQALATAIDEQEELTVGYWRGLGYEARDRGDGWVTAGTTENLVGLFLQGKTPGGTDAQTGSRLKKPDTVSPIRKDTDWQGGIPLEYRLIQARPKAANLTAELVKLTNEARAINLSRVSAERKAEIEEQVKA